MRYWERNRREARNSAVFGGSGSESWRLSQDGFGQLLHELLRAMAVQPIGPAFETVLGRSLDDAEIWHDCAQAVEARMRGLERAVAGSGGLCDD